MNFNTCSLTTLLRLCESTGAPIMITDAHFRVLDYSASMSLLANTKELVTLQQLYCSTIKHVVTTHDLFGIGSLLLPYHLDTENADGYIIFFNTSEKETSDIRQNLLFTELAHDIRSPLSSLISSVSLLNKAIPKEISPQCRELINIIGRTSEKIYEMTQNLLVLSQISLSNKGDLPKQRIDLVAYLTQYHQDMNTILAERNIRMDFSSSTPHLTITTELVILERIITNLVSNAIRHANPNTISILLIATQNSYTITIADNGIGMECTSIDKLMNRFTTERNPFDTQGFGLGLSIVKTYTEFLNGELSLSSTVDEGSAFSITFPLLQEQQKHEVMCNYNFIYSATYLKFSFLFDENQEKM